MDMRETIISKNSIYKFYTKQLEKFVKLGIGNLTENNVVVTEALISVTEKRLRQLKPFIKTIRTRRK